MPDGFAGADEVAVEVVELRRVLAERLRQAGAGFDAALEVHHEAREARVGCGRGRRSRTTAAAARPARSIVASWRVKNVMSFSVTLLPPRKVSRLIFWTRMPWRRRLVVTTVCDAALDSPRTWRLLRSTPSQTNVYSLTSLRRAAAARCGGSGHGADSLSGEIRCGYSLVMASISSSEVTPSFTLMRPGLAQVAHAFLLRLVGDVERVAVAHDELPHLVGDRHDLVDADAALVARALALVAADRAVRLPGAVDVLLGEAGAAAAPPAGCPSAACSWRTAGGRGAAP